MYIVVKSLGTPDCHIHMLVFLRLLPQSQRHKVEQDLFLSCRITFSLP